MRLVYSSVSKSFCVLRVKRKTPHFTSVRLRVISGQERLTPKRFLRVHYLQPVLLTASFICIEAKRPKPVVALQRNGPARQCKK